MSSLPAYIQRQGEPSYILTVFCRWTVSLSDTGKRAIFFWGILVAVLAGSAVLTKDARASTRFSMADKTLRCLNVLQPFGFGRSSGTVGSAVYDVDPFQNGGRDLEVMPEDRLRKIYSAGFDCVRMAIDVAALMAASDDTVLDRLVEQLVTGIARRVSSRLKVIADIHPFPIGTHPVSGYSDIDIVDGPRGPKFLRLVEVVSRLSRAIAKRFQPSDVALELFNEPPSPDAFSKRASWNIQIEAYWNQIRRILPDHTLIVSGMGFAEIDGTITGSWSSGLTNLRPERFDANTGFAFHPYESPLFTHQGDAGFFSHVHGLSFPAASHPGGQQKAESDFIAAVNADATLSLEEKRRLIEDFVGSPRHSYSFSRYWRQFGSAEALAVRLSVVTAWADRHGVDRRQIMNTEFGVNRNQTYCNRLAPSTSAAAFINATYQNSVRARIGVITIHEAQGSCFAISDSADPFAFDQEIISALGIR